ncbi:MAG: trypsin-like peptidase domain-containing protein [Candidatus Dormibacteria bacterium]
MCLTLSAVLPTNAGAASADNPAIREAMTVAKPSVVFLYVRIQGSLLDHRDGQVHGPYTSSSKGSGFFINASGDIVTATHVVSPTADDIQTALVDRYIIAVTGTQLATNNPTFLAYMQSTVVQNVTLDVRAITQAMNIPGAATDDDLYRLGLPATTLASTPVPAFDVSIIHVDKTREPAVMIHQGEVPPNSASVVLIGYPQMAPTFSTAPDTTFGQLTQVINVGSTLPLPTGNAQVPRQATVVVTNAYSEHGVSGGPGINEQDEVVGLVSFGALAGTPIFLVSANDINAVLAKAGVTNTLSDGDQQWRSGVAAQQRGDNGAAGADYRRCLDETPDNTGCKQSLASLTSNSSSGGAPIGLIIGVVLVAVLLLGAAGWWFFGRPEPEYDDD